MWILSSNFSLLQLRSDEVGVLAVIILLDKGRVGVGHWFLLISNSKSQVLHCLVSQVIFLQSQVFWYFEFLIIFDIVLVTWQNKWMTLSPMHRFLLVLEEVSGGNLLSEIVHERSCGFGLGKSHICFETLTIVVISMWRRHRRHLAAHDVKIDLLSDRMACMTAHHRRMIGWRVRLRQLVLVVELLWHWRLLYTLGNLHYCQWCAVTLFQ